MLSTSNFAPRFALLCCAFLHLQQVVNTRLIPTSADQLEASFIQRRDSYSLATPLTVNYDEYNKLCGEGSDSKHPCFTHWYGDISNVIMSSSTRQDMAKEVLVKDDAWTDFTVKDPSKDFTITYLNANGAWLKFSQFDPATGCYDIRLNVESADSDGWRIFVADDDGDNRDIDTKNYTDTHKTLCTKWLRIHVKRDGF